MDDKLMDQDTPEFQDASQSAAEKIRNFILLLSKAEGQSKKTAFTGALCAMAETAINFRPADLDPSAAIERAADTMIFYGAQNILGAAINYDKPGEKPN